MPNFPPGFPPTNKIIGCLRACVNKTTSAVTTCVNAEGAEYIHTSRRIFNVGFFGLSSLLGICPESGRTGVAELVHPDFELSLRNPLEAGGFWIITSFSVVSIKFD
jgi:hypothetical protein